MEYTYTPDQANALIKLIDEFYLNQPIWLDLVKNPSVLTELDTILNIRYALASENQVKEYTYKNWVHHALNIERNEEIKNKWKIVSNDILASHNLNTDLFSVTFSRELRDIFGTPFQNLQNYTLGITFAFKDNNKFNSSDLAMRFRVNPDIEVDLRKYEGLYLEMNLVKYKLLACIDTNRSVTISGELIKNVHDALFDASFFDRVKNLIEKIDIIEANKDKLAPCFEKLSEAFIDVFEINIIDFNEFNNLLNPPQPVVKAKVKKETFFEWLHRVIIGR